MTRRGWRLRGCMARPRQATEARSFRRFSVRRLCEHVFRRARPEALMDKESLEQLLGRGLTISEIAKRFGCAPSTVGFWIEKHGLEPVHRATHAREIGMDRERLEALTAAGMTVAQIAAELHVTPITVRRRLARFGLRTARASRRDAGAAQKDAGLLVATLLCASHGETEFVLEGRGFYRCKRCRAERVAERSRKAKTILVAEAGGRCCICGYDRYIGALEFHHLDRAEKRLEVIAKGSALSLETLRKEARKCVLLCSNCHAEVESGFALLPIK